jgi:hypothetical protein
MPHNGTWASYTGGDASGLALGLALLSAALLYLGRRWRQPVGVARPGHAVSGLLLVMWGLALATFLIAIATYVGALFQQQGVLHLPTSPIAPVTTLSSLVTFVVIAYLSRAHGWKLALGSACVGTAAAPMIFELPFDLIVMARTYAPAPALQYTLLFFLPLFLLEVSTFSLLTLSPLVKLSRVTWFSLAGMFGVFAAWAALGFAYPADPAAFGLNVLSKLFSFGVAITLFLPHPESLPAEG